MLKKSCTTVALMMMKQRRLAAILMLTMFIAMSPLMFEDVIVHGGNGKIDLFTQKEPFSGKGLNMPSDAFAPGEIVFLYALVEYNGYPRQNLLVTFSIKSPNGTSFSFTAITNTSGIASMSFTIPQKCPPHENETFGEWFVRACVVIGDTFLQDTLTFKVGWLVELLGVRTIDRNMAPRDSFGITGDVGLEISLKNIAMTEKKVTLTAVIQDELNVPVNSLAISDIEIQPNEKTVYLYTKLSIPKWAVVGKAIVYVSAFTKLPSQNGVAYCPSISTEFFITPYNPLRLEFRDIAIIKVTSSATSVKIGEPIHVSVKVRNEGTLTESFNVSLLMDNQVIDTLNVLNLAPYSSTTLNFTIDTRDLVPKSYLISVAIPPLLNEADTTDNILADGYIEVRPSVRRFLVIFEGAGLSLDAQGIILTINGSAKSVKNLPCSLFVEEGSVLIYTYEENVLSAVLGKRFKLREVIGPPSPVTVRSNITIVGQYVTQYYLLVSSIYGSPTPKSGWFDAGAIVNASVVSPWPGPEGTRHVCLGWIGTGSVPLSGSECTVTFIIHQPSSIVWLWKTQYYLTVISPYGVVGGGGWYDANVTAYAFLDVGVFDHGNETRRVFVYWSGDASGVNYARSSPILMDGPKVAVANWKTQYLLTVATNPAGLSPQPSRSPLGEAGPAGGWWYDAHVNVSLLAPPVRGYDFSHWEVDGRSLEVGQYALTVFMDGPHVAVAYYNVRVAGWFVPEWLYWILLLILILVIILLCVWIYRRRRRAKSGEAAFKRGWTAWYYGYDLLGRSRRVK